MKKKTEKNLNLVTSSIIVVIHIFIICFSVYGVFSATEYFYVGYHNLDTAQNMRYLEQVFNTTLLDQYELGKYINATQSYLLGVKQLRFGFEQGLFSAFLFGWSLAYLIMFLISLKSQEKKK